MLNLICQTCGSKNIYSTNLFHKCRKCGSQWIRAGQMEKPIKAEEPKIVKESKKKIKVKEAREKEEEALSKIFDDDDEDEEEDLKEEEETMMTHCFTPLEDEEKKEILDDYEKEEEGELDEEYNKFVNGEEDEEE